jgi:hypothetical protein
MRAGASAAVLLLLTAGLAAALHGGFVAVPDRWNPWAPLSIDDAPNFLTTYKLARLASHPPACQSTLASGGVRFTAQPDRALDGDCGWTAAVRISALPTAVSQPFVLECPAAAALALWERHSVQPQARRIAGSRVARIDHVGSFGCRNIGGEANARRSEHARANALDVAGFLLADGSTIRVARDWHGDDAPGRFVREVHADACRFWNVVLGPDYNAAHRDHLHLDRGAARACR